MHTGLHSQSTEPCRHRAERVAPRPAAKVESLRNSAHDARRLKRCRSPRAPRRQDAEGESTAWTIVTREQHRVGREPRAPSGVAQSVTAPTRVMRARDAALALPHLPRDWLLPDTHWSLVRALWRRRDLPELSRHARRVLRQRPARAERRPGRTLVNCARSQHLWSLAKFANTMGRRRLGWANHRHETALFRRRLSVAQVCAPAGYAPQLWP